MKRIHIEVDSRKYSEHTTSIPDDIIEEGDEAIRDYLWRSGAIDQALDYSISSNTEVNYLIDDE